MRLSELKTGEKATIVKVLGHGGFRKRIVEMGFIRGQEVEAMLNAPLQDPVKYKIMGYEVSLRHNEAFMIEVVAEGRGSYVYATLKPPAVEVEEENGGRIAAEGQYAAKQMVTINIALVGNPNCGKTSLFNFASGAHERVGNYSGVTVDAKEGHVSFEGYVFNIVDLPGTYSLSAYSPEELFVRKQIIDNTPDVIVNVLDSSNLERNLYLSTQLVDMNLRIVGALNMFDEFEQRGDHLDTKVLGGLFGFPIVPTVFKTGRGVEELFRTIIKVYEGEERQARHVHLNHGKVLEKAISSIQTEIQKNDDIRYKYSTRYLAIKLLEGDGETKRVIGQLPNAQQIKEATDKEIAFIRKETGEDSETAVMDAKYGVIHGALQEAGYQQGNGGDIYETTHILDRIITHKYAGFPIFILLLYLMFQVTFTLGAYPMDWIDMGIGALGDLIADSMKEGPLKDMLIDGVIGGVGAVIVFLPQILILYAFISFMEDSGYMARAAFVMDKLMHKMGLHGKSFIPLIMGFGCNVPAIMATRTIESRRSRLVTMLILPFMSCSARLPIYIMVTATFFAVKYQSLVMISLYIIGIVVAIVMSNIFCRILVRGEDTPFVMELPPYRFPTTKATLRHMWEKGKQYLRKMGGIILVASIIVWCLGYFPHNEELTEQQQQEQSYIGRIGKTIEPVFIMQGFDWKLDVGLIAGLGAKEIVASTMGVLYSGAEIEEDETGNRYEELRSAMEADGITPVVAFAYMVFVLLYFPCIAAIAAIKNESGSWKWAVFGAVYTTCVAWIVSALVYQIGILIQ